MVGSKGLTGMKGGGLTELKQRLFVVFIGIVVFRLGSYIPIPGIDPVKLAQFFNANDNGLVGMLNMFTGGSFKRYAIFALGIMPFISASIIFQLLTAVSPKLSELKKEGEAGQRKITQYTRYATVGLAIFQSAGFAKLMLGQGVVLYPPMLFYIVSIITMTTGTLFVMWMGEQMTERGIGNGISLIICAGIIANLPTAVVHVIELARQGNISVMILLLVVAIVLVVTAFVVFVERAQRRITVNYAKRQQGRKMVGAQSSFLPLKINMSGVIPPIFASSILMFPQALTSWFAQTPGLGWLREVSLALSFGSPVYVLVFVATIFFFCFFYTALVFNPKETADNLKKSGAFIPGIRPGDQTAKYIDGVMSRLTLAAGVYVSLICLLPMFLINELNMPFYFGGTSLMIIVVVVMDFIAQVQSHLMSTRYDSLLKKSNLRGGGMGGLS